MHVALRAARRHMDCTCHTHGGCERSKDGTGYKNGNSEGLLHAG